MKILQRLSFCPKTANLPCFIGFPLLAQFICCFPLSLCLALLLAFFVDKENLFLCLLQVILQGRQILCSSRLQSFLLSCGWNRSRTGNRTPLP